MTFTGFAVDGDERAALAIALALDGACNQFLTDAAFTFDQNRNVRCRRAFAERDDTLHGVAVQDEVAERQRAFGFLLDAIDFARQGFDFQSALHRHIEPLGGCRLDDKVDGAGAHGVDGGFDRERSCRLRRA